MILVAVVLLLILYLGRGTRCNPRCSPSRVRSELATSTGAGIAKAGFQSTIWMCCSLGSGGGSAALRPPAEKRGGFAGRGGEAPLGCSYTLSVPKAHFTPASALCGFTHEGLRGEKRTPALQPRRGPWFSL